MPLDQVRLRAFLNGEAVPDEEDEVPQIRQQDVTAPGTSAPLARSGKLNTVGLRKMLNEKAVMQAVPNEEVEFSVLDSLARGSLNFGANVSSAFGAEDTADSLRQTAAENYAAATPDVMALEGVGDTASFFGERFLENMPNLGATGAAFLSGAAIGTAVGGPIGGAIGGAAGALTSVAVPMFGESRSGVIKATGEDQPFAAVPAAAVNTAIEFIPLGMVAKRLGILDPVKDAVREATEELGRDGLTVLKDATSSFLKVGATEAGVEVIQSYNNLVTQKLLNDESIFKLNAEDRHELINAAAGGAAAGGGMGAVSSVIGNRFAGEAPAETPAPAPAPAPTPTPPPEVTPPPTPTPEVTEVPPEPAAPVKKVSVVTGKRLKGNLTAAGIANRNLTRMEEKLETANMLYSDDRGRVTNGAMLETARARVETARRAVERKDGLIEATHRKWFDAGHTAEQWNAMVEEEFGHTDEYNWNQMVEGTDMETQGPLLDRAEDRIGSGIFRAIERHLGTGQTPVESVPEAAPAVAPPPAPPTPLDELKAQIRERMAKIEGNDQILEDAANRANPDDGEFESELSTLFPTAPHQANTPGQSGTGPWTKFNHNTSEAVAFGELMSNGKRTGGNAIFTNIFVEAKDAEGDTVTTVVPLKQENIRPGSVNVVASELQSTRFSDGMAGQIASPQGFGGRSDAMGLLQTVQRELQALMRDMGLDMKLLIGEDSTINALMGWNSTRGTALGFAGSINDGTMVIGLDLEAILSDPNSLYNRDKDSAQAQLLDSAFHEFGHTVFAHQWQTASSVQKKGLLQGYKEYMQESMTLPAQAFIAKYYPISKQQLLRGRKEGKGLTFMEYLSAKSKGDGITTTKKGLESVSYILNFDEYVANQFARRATRKTSSKQLLSPEAEGFFAAALAKLRRLYRLIRSRTKTTATFDAYVDNLLLNTEVAKMIARQREMEGKAETETEESRALQGELEDEGGTGERDTLSEGTRILDEAPEPNVIASVLDNIGLEEEATQLREHQSVQLGFVKIIKLLTPIQIAKMAKKSGILNPAAYMDLVRVFSNTKMKQVEIADEVVRKWKALGKDKAKRVSKMLFDASAKSDELGRRLTSEEEQALANQIDMSDEEFAAWREVDQSFRDILVEIERALILDAAKAYITDREQAKRFRDEYLATLDPAEQGRVIEFYTGQQLIPDDPNDPLVNALWTEMERIKGKMGVLRKKNYFPRSRLGQYTVTVTSNREGQTWEGTTSKRAKETLGFYAFDSSKARDQFLKFIQPDMATEDLNSAGSKMETEQFSFMGMPQVMLDQMLRKEKEAISENTNLTEMEKQIAIKAVETRFNDVSLALTPGRRFLQFMRKKRGVAGHSEDAIRAYSRYMSSASNHLARTEHARDLIETLNDMDAGIRQALQEGKGVILDDLVTLRDYYRKHFSYMMSPENDWAALRSVGFLWYLGLNVKSALVNLTQIPMVTYPKLAGTYGDKKAGVALGKAYWGITGHTIGKVQLTPDQLRMIDEMRSTGIIDESMVMELVGMGEADVLKRNIPGWDADNMLNKASYYGGAMFRWGEKYNRLVTALAAYNLARDSGMTHEQATVRTRKDIESSQFEYAKWNRPEFMRGKKSVLFLFWNYMQHVTFAFAGGEGKGTAKRMWLMSLMVAGLEGLPFAETILDLLDFGGTQMKKAVGSANPRVALREDMRDMLLEMTDKPDLFLNGLSSYYGLGPMHLATLLGAPVPNIDVSGSLGMGRPIPWMEPILGAAKNPDEKLGKITASVLGPVGAIPYQLYKSISSTDPDVWKRVEKTLPVFAKNAVQGTRWLATGEETFRGAGTFQEFQTPELRVAAAMKTLGFTSTVMSQKYNQIMATQEASVFWSLRKSMLLEDFHYALETGGREAVADARNAIKNHNKGMRETKGLRGLQITGSDLRQSVMQRKRSVRKRELGRPGSNKEIGLAREQQRRFPVVGE